MRSAGWLVVTTSIALAGVPACDEVPPPPRIDALVDDDATDDDVPSEEDGASKKDGEAPDDVAADAPPDRPEMDAAMADVVDATATPDAPDVAVTTDVINVVDATDVIDVIDATDVVDVVDVVDVRDVVDVPDARDAGPVDAGPPTMFVATLQGAQEVPPVYATAATGSATVSLSADRTRLSWTVTHTLAGVNAAHFHLGIAGESGAVTIPLTPAPNTFSGSATVTPEQAAALDEGRVYLNLHSAMYPTGEIRGQVLRPGETLWLAHLSGAQEVPPVTPDLAGVAQVLVAPTRDSVRYIVHGPVAPTMAHIHTGAGGTNGPVTYDLLAGTSSALAFGGAVTVSPAALNDLASGRWYVNLHTAAAPAGATRGQFLRPGEVLYTGQFSGAAEVPPFTTTATGSIAVVLTAERARLVYDAAFTGVTSPTVSHLHVGAAGVSGPVAVDLTIASPTSLLGSANVPVTPTDFLPRLDAGEVYANIHSTRAPGGELRAQLLRR